MTQSAKEEASLDWFRNCAKNCEVGTSEVLKMQQKHTEVARLTYAKNIQRCLSIHGNPMIEEEEVDAIALAHCVSHNTDKIDRRFFGYYNNQKLSLVNKFLF